jgi:uncharacterized protein YjbJ (UPF0337 family)
VNNDILQGRWKQVRGRAQGLWGKFARRNRVRVSGKRDEIAGTLQEKYGNVRAKAKQTLHRILK